MPYIPQPINFNVGQGAAAAGTPVSEELWSTPNANVVQIGTNGSSWRGMFLKVTSSADFVDKTITKITLRLFSFDSGSTDEAFQVGIFDTSEAYSGTPLTTFTGTTANNNNELTGSFADYEFEGSGVVEADNAIGLMITRSDGVSDNLVQLATNSSGMPTGCEGINYSQTATTWNNDVYANGKALIGSGEGY